MSRSTFNLLLGFGTLIIAFGLVGFSLWRRRRRARTTLDSWKSFAARAGLESVQGELATGGPALKGEYRGLAFSLRGEHGSNPIKGHTFFGVRLSEVVRLPMSLTALAGLGIRPEDARGIRTGDADFDALFVVAADASVDEVAAALSPVARRSLCASSKILEGRSLQFGGETLEVLQSGIEADSDTLHGILELLADLAPEAVGPLQVQQERQEEPGGG